MCREGLKDKDKHERRIHRSGHPITITRKKVVCRPTFVVVVWPHFKSRWSRCCELCLSALFLVYDPLTNGQTSDRLKSNAEIIQVVRNTFTSLSTLLHFDLFLSSLHQSQSVSFWNRINVSCLFALTQLRSTGVRWRRLSMYIACVALTLHRISSFFLPLFTHLCT